MEAIQNVIKGTFIVKVAGFCSFLGEELVPIAVMAVFYWCIDKDFGKYIATSVATGCVANPMVKNLFMRRRPYFDNPGIECLRPVEKGYDIYDIVHQGWSFPSGHSTNSVACFTALAVYKKKNPYIILGILLPLFIGCSRFCLGVHYPTDVMVGWLLGGIVMMAVYLMTVMVKDKRNMYLVLLIMGLPGLIYCRTADYFTAYGLMVGLFAGFLFEDSFVHFETTHNVLRGIIRVVLGIAIFEGFNTLVKLPLDPLFLASSSVGSLVFRIIRYAVDSFLIAAVYPLLFKVGDKIFKKK